MRVYMDNAATTRVIEPVFEAMKPYLCDIYGNPSSVHGFGREALTALDTLYRAEVPAFPLMYRPDEFFEFNASNWTNWPTEDNDYAPPMFRGAGNTWIFELKKIGE